MRPRQPGLTETLRQLPRPAWVLYGGTFINRFGSFVAVFLVLYMTRKGYGPAQAGLAVGAFGLGAIPGSLLSGFTADRVGRRETIVGASVLSAIVTIGLAFADGLPMLVGLAALCGLGNQLFRAPTSAMLADLVPERRRMAAIGVMRLAINAGFAAGPAAAGFLADRSFTLLFAADAATSLAFGVIALLWLPHGAPRRERPRARGEGTRAIIADRPFVVFLVASTLMAAVYAQNDAAFPLWVHDNGFNNATFGALIGLNGAVIVVIELVLITYLQRFRPRPLIVTGFMLVGGGFMMTAGAHTVPVLALTVLVWTAGEMLAFPAGTVQVANAAPTHLRGRYQGAYGLSWSIGWTVGPAAGSWLYARSPLWLWMSCGLLGLAAAGIVAVLPDMSGAREDANSTPEPVSA